MTSSPPCTAHLYREGSFRQLFPSERHHGANLAGPAGSVPDALYSTVVDGNECVVTPLGRPGTVLCRVRGQQIFVALEQQARLRHGDELKVGDRDYRVYTERPERHWAKQAPPLDSESWATLQEMGTDRLTRAAQGFLLLPYVVAQWARDFERDTGFVQCRDGRVPRPRRVSAVAEDRTVQLTWDVRIWSLFEGDWVPDREEASYDGRVGAPDVGALLECESWWAPPPELT